MIYQQTLIDKLPRNGAGELANARSRELRHLLTMFSYSQSELALISREIDVLNAANADALAARKRWFINAVGRYRGKNQDH